MGKIVILVGALLFSPFFIQDKAKAPDTKSLKPPAPILVPEKDRGELALLWNDAVTASEGFRYATSLLSDTNGCTKQVLLLLQKDSESRQGKLQNRLLNLKLDLSIPKDWQFDPNEMAFKAPAPK
jgi:hypothetical protein